MGSCMSSCSRQSKAPRARRRTRAKRRRADPPSEPCKPRGEIGDEELQMVPGRMVTNGASDVACVFTQQGRKGTNQDAMIVWENFASGDDTVFCGVFDGHGPYGHLVAKKIRDTLPLKVANQWKAHSCDENNFNQNGSAEGSRNSDETFSINMDEEWIQPLDNSDWEKFPEVYIPLRQSLLKAYKLMDKELKSHPMIDCFCSGSTAITLIKQGQDLIIGNVGDSRAVLGTRAKDNTLVAIQLTVDLKPNLPSEAARIQQCKGRVFALQDEPEVARVWLPNSDSPGLAMARAFGDFCLKDYGLISVPDTSYRRLTERDEFIVLATDGVWDVLSNKEVVDVIASAPTRGTAARALVDSAVRAWRLKFPTSKIDDCAVVCLYVHPQPSSDQEYDLTPKTSTDNIAPTTTVLAAQGAADANDVHPSEFDSSKPICSPINHTSTSAGVEEIEPIETPKIHKLQDRSPSTRSLAECISTAEEEEWSALEGVTRVNSLLNLPRFLSGDKRSTNRRKWL